MAFVDPYTKLQKFGVMSSKQVLEHGVIHCLYAETQQWFKSLGININAPPSTLVQYSLDCPQLNTSKVEMSRVFELILSTWKTKYHSSTLQQLLVGRWATIRRF